MKYVCGKMAGVLFFGKDVGEDIVNEMETKNLESDGYTVVNTTVQPRKLQCNLCGYIGLTKICSGLF